MPARRFATDPVRSPRDSEPRTFVAHVRSDAQGLWAVEVEGEVGRSSVHLEAMGATLTAASHVRSLGGGRVVVHDRYGRLRATEVQRPCPPGR